MGAGIASAVHIRGRFRFGDVPFARAEARAQGLADVRYEVLAPDEKAIIDHVAAEFFENELSPVQARTIEARTSEAYISADPERRAMMRGQRRAEWRAMNEGRRNALMDAKQPLYDNLNEDQRVPFRRHALNRLSAAAAPDADALVEALRGDI